jgi:uncharacterized membrane protein
MNRIRFLSAAVLSTLIAIGGCSSMSPTDKGVVGGAVGGGVVGGVVGHALHNTAAGAAIGAVAGGVTGGLVGNAVEKKQAKDAAAAAAAASEQGKMEIIDMVHNHVDDNVIITKIRISPVVYQLSSQDVLMLKQNGVSDVVVNEMMATAMRVPAPRRVYSEAPVYGPPPGTVVVVEQPPPPAPVVGVGFVGRIR